MDYHINEKQIIVEGLWDVGKTTLCEYLHDTHNFVFAKEPDHAHEGVPEETDLDSWYINAHLYNIKSVMESTSTFCMERSMASSVAFIEAREGVVPNNLLSDERIIHAKKYYSRMSYCVYLKASPQNYSIIRNIRKDGRIDAFLTDAFVRNYIQSLEKWLHYFFPGKVKEINLFNQNGVRVSETAINSQIDQLV